MVIQNYKSLNIQSAVNVRKSLIKNKFVLKYEVFIRQNDHFGHVKCPAFIISSALRANIYEIVSYLAFYPSILL